ncbi:MAG TPA: class F sortase [Jatrophihabitantaceae bacterium]|nr:class F sortase [Jatrophihabitantaceae bacterium]
MDVVVTSLRVARPGRQVRAMAGRVGAVVAGCLLAGLFGTGPADAAPGGNASIRVADLAAALPGLDLYLTAFSGAAPRVTVPDTRYASVSAYTLVRPGPYVVSAQRHGASAGSRAVLSTTVNTRPGKAYTIAVLGDGAALRAVVLADDLTTPAAGFGRVRVIQAAHRAPSATVTAVHGPVLANRTAFAASSRYTQLRAGAWQLRAESVGGTTLTAAATVSVASGTVTSILLLDRPGGGLAIRTVHDAAAPARPPSGAVPTGGGGMASAVSASPRVGAAANWLGALAVLVAGCLAIARARRRAATSGSGSGRLAGGLAFVMITVAGITAASMVGPPWNTLLSAPAPSGAAVVSPPVRLRLPAIGVDTALQALRLQPDGSLQAPSAWQEAGWYADGVRPGALGPAVIAGHVDSRSGPAVFFRLGELRPGDRVVVQQHVGRALTFVVDDVARYPKTNFPTASVYSAAPVPELRLITCAGEFDARARSYLDNLVVSAHLVG